MVDNADHVLVTKLGDWLDSNLVVVDVGARWGVGQRWRSFGDRVSVFGFEPDVEECARLNDTEGREGKCEFVPLALGARVGTATLYLTDDPACSSLFRPMEKLIRHRPELACTTPVGASQVAMTTLDEWLNTSDHEYVDVLKLDTQGSELGVLEGAVEALAGISILEVEVEFNEIYEGQPLFGDVDRFLRNQGFVLWRLQQLVHYGFHDVPSARLNLHDTHYFDSRPVTISGAGGQLFWGHAYFIPERLAFAGESAMSWQQAVRGASAAAAFGFADLALSLLERGAVNTSPQTSEELAATSAEYWSRVTNNPSDTSVPVSAQIPSTASGAKRTARLGLGLGRRVRSVRSFMTRR